ncbi:hypothetical protein [Parabacteroides sp. FAFU027]|uniref:hypothetical protein n=1 Tax=Parabacteroides sp. FAFU027 TaxID=2922715 RepID=UPI001FB03691|nr:hypothetical protein [Parabacteroides sp. FAFU027]
MRSLIITLSMFFSLTIYGQNKPVNFNECNFDGVFMQAQVEPQWNSKKMSLIEYLNKTIIDKNLERVKNGRIILGIIVNEQGKTCCHSFLNLTDKELDPAIYKDAVNKMPDWTPGKQSGYAIPFCKTVLLNIRNGRFVE